jgi:hypothetical protein
VGVSLLLLFLFLSGPFSVTRGRRLITSSAQIAAWKAEFHRLDGMAGKTTQEEAQRMAAADSLLKRGIDVDPGLRDESIDHHLTPYTVFVRVIWA